MENSPGMPSQEMAKPPLERVLNWIKKRIIVMLLHGQVDGFAATQGFVCLYGFHHGISLYKLNNCSLYLQM